MRNAAAVAAGASRVARLQRLVKFYNDGELSFRHVVTFNMVRCARAAGTETPQLTRGAQDEYVELPRESEQSYHSFMYKHLFSHVDIPPSQVNMLDGNAPDLCAECERVGASVPPARRGAHAAPGSTRGRLPDTAAWSCFWAASGRVSRQPRLRRALRR